MVKIYPQKGFTLIELMLVVAIIGVLVAIALPSYNRYVIRTKRVDMMTELQAIGSTIENRKMAKGNYADVDVSNLPTGDYPKSGTALYTVSVTPNPLTAEWTVTATPKSNGQMKNDGVLTFNAKGVKCRDSKCGESWRE